MFTYLSELLEQKRTELDDEERAVAIAAVCNSPTLVYCWYDEMDFYQRLPLFKVTETKILNLVDLTLHYDAFTFAPENMQVKDPELIQAIDQSGVFVIDNDFFGCLKGLSRYKDGIYDANQIKASNAIKKEIFNRFRKILLGLFAAYDTEQAYEEMIENPSTDEFCRALSMRNIQDSGLGAYEDFLEKVDNRQLLRFEYTDVVEKARERLAAGS